MRGRYRKGWTAKEKGLNIEVLECLPVKHPMMLVAATFSLSR